MNLLKMLQQGHVLHFDLEQTADGQISGKLYIEDEENYFQEDEDPRIDLLADCEHPETDSAGNCKTLGCSWNSDEAYSNSKDVPDDGFLAGYQGGLPANAPTIHPAPIIEEEQPSKSWPARLGPLTLDQKNRACRRGHLNIFTDNKREAWHRHQKYGPDGQVELSCDCEMEGGLKGQGWIEGTKGWHLRRGERRRG